MEEINEKLHIDLLNFDEGKRQEWANNRKPYAVLFELTPRCNFNCIHCYLKENHIYEQLPYERVIEIIDILFEQGILFLTLTGGEILLRPDFLDIYMYAKKKGFFVELFTNGMSFSDEIINTLAKYPPLLIDISLYGSCENTYKEVTCVSGAFDKVISNCKKLIKAGVRISLKTPVLKQTLEELDDMRGIADNLGVPFVYTFEITPTITGDTSVKSYSLPASISLKYEFDNYYEQLRNGERIIDEDNSEMIKMLKENPCIYSCNVAVNSFVVDYKGNICPCMKLRHKGVRLCRDTFNEVWDEFGEIRKRKASPSYVCKTCDYKYFCDVCPAEMDLLYNDAEYRPLEVCKCAMIRKQFYQHEITLDEALKKADL